MAGQKGAFRGGLGNEAAFQKYGAVQKYLNLNNRRGQTRCTS